MGIRFLCPTCSRKLNIKAHLAGKRGICPHCQAKILIPPDAEAPGSSIPAAPVDGSTPSPVMELPAKALVLPPATPDMRGVSIDLSWAGAKPTDRMSPAASHASTSDLPPALAADPHAIWYVGTADGRQFGPADATRMSQWFGEGRVSPESLVWREGWDHWRPVREVFPQASPAGEPAPSPPPLLAATTESPVARAVPIAEGPLASVSLVGESPDAGPLVGNLSRSAAATAERRLRARRKQWRLTTTATLIVLFMASIVLIAVLFYVLAAGPIEW